MKKAAALFLTFCLIAMCFAAVPVSAGSAGGGGGGGIIVPPPQRTFTVPVENAEPGAKIILALYNGNALADIIIKKYDGNAVSFRSYEAYDQIKAFVWSENGMEPFSEELDYSQIVYGDDDSIVIDIASLSRIITENGKIYGILYFADPDDYTANKLRIDSDAVYYYNGKRISPDDAISCLRDVYEGGETPYGKLQLVRVGYEDDFSIVYITEYNYNEIVSEVDKENKKVTTIYGGNISFISSETEYVFYKEDGSMGSFDDIEKNSVLTFAESKDGKLCAVYISNKKVTGIVTEKGYIDFGYGCRIGDDTYKINEEYESVEPGDKGTFYINFDNTVVYAERETNEKYAYLFKAGTASSAFSDGTVQIKYLKTDGTWEVKDLASSITICKGYETVSGIKPGSYQNDYQKLEALSELFEMDGSGEICGAKPQLITFKTNAGGEINKLYVASDSADRNCFSMDYSGSGMVYSKKDNKLGDIPLKKNTKVLCINTAHDYDEDGFFVSTSDMVFRDNQEYMVDVYDMNTFGYPAIIVAYDAAAAISEADPIFVVDRVAYATSAEGFDVYKFYGFQNGERVSLESSADFYMDYDLEAGDVILYSPDFFGKVNDIEVLFTKYMASDYIYEGTVPEISLGEAEEVFGKVTAKKPGNTVTLDSGEDYALTGDKLKIYKVNLISKSATVSVASYDDITAVSSDSGYGSWAYLRFCDGEAIGAVIYQKSVKAAEDDIIEISASQLNDVSEQDGEITGISYLDATGNAAVELLFAPGAKYYYNGVEADAEAAAEFIWAILDGEYNYNGLGGLRSGKIKFVRDGGDNAFSNVYITEYNYSCVVDKIDENGRVIDTYGNLIEFDYYDTIAFYKEDGSIGSFDDIEKGSVVSFAESEDWTCCCSVYISNKKVTGTVTEKGYEGNVTFCYIDGNYYKCNDNDTVSVGDKGTFYINIDNAVVYAKLETNVNYVYLFKAGIKSGTVTGDKVQIKYLKDDGTWEIKDLADRITVYKGNEAVSGIRPQEYIDDGYQIEALGWLFDIRYNEIRDAKPQLITFKTNSSGEINKLYAAKDMQDKLCFSKDYSSSGVTYSQKYNKLGRVYLKNNTKVFCVDTSEADEEDGYCVTTSDRLFKDGLNYSIDAYDYDDDGYPSVLVAYDAAPDFFIDDPVFVIDRVVPYENDDGNDVYLLYGYRDGEEFSAETAAGCNFNCGELGAGDVIIYKLDLMDKIDDIKVLFYADDAVNYIFDCGDAPALSRDDCVEEDFGMVTKKNTGNRLMLEYDDERQYSLTGDKLKIYTVNVNRLRPVISVASYGDITAYTNEGRLGSWAYVRYYDDEPICAVVYQADIPYRVEYDYDY
ncbi:MAG: hypothetical protein J5590_08135 [Clostridia bacterium]|nr:hypothetical protein [Clostridia bacterium]